MNRMLTATLLATLSAATGIAQASGESWLDAGVQSTVAEIRQLRLGLADRARPRAASPEAERGASRSEAETRRKQAMNKPLIALMFASWSAQAQAARLVENQIDVKPGQKIVVAQDKGKLTVNPSTGATLSYRVEFVPDQRRSWWDRTPGPTQQDYDDCTATYSAEQGLRIHTGKGLSAVAVLNVPVTPALDAQLKAGILAIGQRAGRVEAFIGSGILEYDASGLPAGTCVNASINSGTVANERDFDCSSVGAVLHGHSGIITVK